MDLSQYYVEGVNYNTPEYAQYGYMPKDAYYALFPGMRGKSYESTFTVGGGLTEAQLGIAGVDVAQASQAYQALGGTGQVVLPQSGDVADITFSTPAPTPTTTPYTPTSNYEQGSDSTGIGVLLGIGLLSGLGMMLRGRRRGKRK
jgi:hypothetical protein